MSSAAVSATLRLVRAHPSLIRHVLALAVFVLATAVWFHSVLLHPGSRIPGGFGDGAGAIREYWAASVQHRTPFDFTHDALVGAPQGRTQAAAAIGLANGAVQTAFVWGLRGPFGLVGAWNLFLVLGLVGTGMAMFALLQRLGCSFGASLFGSYVVAFSPYSFERALAGHLAFLHTWIFVALVATLLRLRARRSWLSALPVGAVIGLSFYITAYDALFSMVVVFVFVLVEFERLPRERLRSVALAGLAFLVSIAVLVPVLVAWSSESKTVQVQGTHTGSDFYKFAATMRAYFVPSPRNPFFHWLHGVHPRDLTEQTLYFGYTTVALALVAVVLLYRRNSWFQASDSRRWTAIFFALLVPAAFVMSLPPTYTAGKVTIPTPSLAVALVAGFWRVYSRFGLIVGFALAVLAAMALSALAQRGNRAWRLLAPAALVFVALFELLPGNIQVLNTTARPAWVVWLAGKPRGIVATYPADPAKLPAVDLGRQDLWYQKLDGQPRFAYSGLGYDETLSRPNAIKLAAESLAVPVTARVLATEGVRYVVVHRDVYRAEGQAAPALDPTVFKLLKAFGDVRIYSVTAPRVSIAAVLEARSAEIGALMGFKPLHFAYGTGFDRREPSDGGRWLIDRGRLEITNVAGAGIVTITGHGLSKRSPRLLEVQDREGRVLAEQRIPPNRVSLHLGPFRVPQGAFTLTLVATPGPAPLAATDARLGSVLLSSLTLSPAPDSLEPLPGSS